MKNQNLGKMLRYYRKARQYSIQQVIEALEKEYSISISPKTLYSWENSQNQPSADLLLMLCKLYNINNILETLGYDGDSENMPLILNPEETKLIRKYRARKRFQPAIRKLLDIE